MISPGERGCRSGGGPRWALGLLGLQLATGLRSPPEARTPSLPQRRPEVTEDLPGPTCKHGRLYPELYLIGAQKAATTTLSSSIICGGVPMANRVYACVGEARRARFYQQLQHSGAPKESALMLKSGGGRRLREWEALLPPCPDSPAALGPQRPLVGDYSPAYLRLTMLERGASDSLPVAWHDLPVRMAQIYGEELRGRARFVVLLRTPLARMHSAFYQVTCCRDCHNSTVSVRHEGSSEDLQHLCGFDNFTAALEATVALAEQGRYTDWMWASSYGFQLDQWVSAFTPQQFLVVPFLHVVGKLPQLCGTVSHFLERDLDCSAFEPRHFNTYPHPALEDEGVSKELLQRFHAVMETDRAHLVKVLQRGHERGMNLALYSKPGSGMVEHWLQSNW